MKLRKPALFVLVGLMLVAFAIAMAQSPTQGDQKQKSETCCSMESCCCNSGSCPMKQEGTAGSDAKHADCCCSGDSCEMKGDSAQNHAKQACCNDSCDMKKHDGKHHDGKHHDGKSDCCKLKAKSKSKQKAA